MTPARLIAALLAIPLLAACGRYFRPDINLDRYASDREIVGRWTLRTSSIEVLKRFGYLPPAGKPHELVFHLNGECEYRSAREVAFNRREYCEAQVVWMLQHDAVTWSDKKRKNEVIISFAKDSECLMLQESKGRIVLWSTLGDPDSWEFMEYDKAQ
jgi:polyferredoxin